MTLHGVLVILQQEFRVRLRTGRWLWLLGAWFVVVALFTVLLHMAVSSASGPAGVPMFGGLMLFVLALVLVVSPSLTAQSINGDRERGTLAPLQTTLLRPAEIALGKLLASWAVGLAALGLTLPFVFWSVAEGGVGPRRMIVVLIVEALLMGVVCAVSQGMSALFARTITSAMLSYVVIFALTLGTVIAFGLVGTAISDSYRSRHDRVWWLLAPNPFVVLADAAPALPVQRDEFGYRVVQPSDPLGEIGRSVRSLRDGPSGFDIDAGRRDDPGPVWPYGLAFDLALAGGAFAVTVLRLRTPARTLPRGTRIA